MFTVGEIIEQAREGDPSFGPAFTPNRVLYGELSRYVRRLAGRVQQIDDTALAVTEEIALPLASFEEGEPLPDNLAVSAIYGVGGSGVGNQQYVVPMTLVHPSAKHDSDTPERAAWVEGGVLYLAGAASRWTGLTKLVVTLSPEIDDITSDEEELPLPAEAHDAVVQYLRFELTRRGAARKPEPSHTRADVLDAEGRAARAEEDYLRTVTNRLGGSRFTVRDVTRGRY